MKRVDVPEYFNELERSMCSGEGARALIRLENCELLGAVRPTGVSLAKWGLATTKFTLHVKSRLLRKARRDLNNGQNKTFIVLSYLDVPIPATLNVPQRERCLCRSRSRTRIIPQRQE